MQLFEAQSSNYTTTGKNNSVSDMKSPGPAASEII
jgi:hypothetical protein